VTGLARDHSAILGLLVIAATIVMAVLAPALAPGDPVKNSLVDRLTPPMWNAGGTAKHPLGTDTLGRDVASRLLYGARVSLIVGLAAVVVAGALGVALGLVSGY
jgi:peptide/nickel transport system permease protein